MNAISSLLREPALVDNYAAWKAAKALTRAAEARVASFESLSMEAAAYVASCDAAGHADRAGDIQCGMLEQIVALTGLSLDQLREVL